MDAFPARASRLRTGLLALGAAGALVLAGALFTGTSAPKSLLLPEPLSALPDLGDYAWNPLAQNQAVALILWLVVVEALGWLAWPLAATVCRRLPDRGVPLSKTLALVLLAWPVWLAASLRLAPFTVWSILGAIGLLALAAGLVWRRDGPALRAYLAARRRLVLAWEGLFGLAFAAFLALRLYDPDLWQPARGGEKPMDFGFLNAILRSAWMPPPDPFFAGGYVNYYYYGQFLVASLIKLIGCAPAVGYNLALPLLYALLVLGAASLVYNVVASIRRARGVPARADRVAFGWGLGGAGLVAVAGNLQGGLQVLSMAAPGLYQPLLGWFQSWGMTAPGLSHQITSFDYWSASRVAPRIIDEFPYWIFLFGELHAHEIVLPFSLLVAGLAFNLLLAGWAPTSPPTPSRTGEGSIVGIVGQGAQKPSPRRGEGRVRGESRLTTPSRYGAVPPAGEALAPPLIAYPDPTSQEGNHPTPPSHTGKGAGGLGPAPAGPLDVAVTALALGALAVINTWDFITYGAILAAVATLAAVRGRQRAKAQGHGSAPYALRIAYYAIAAALILGGALMAYAPYFLNFQAFYNQIRPVLEGVDGERRTKLAEWLIIWGLFAFIAASYLGRAVWRYPWAAAWADLRRRWDRRQVARRALGFALTVAPPAVRAADSPTSPSGTGHAGPRGLLPPVVGLGVLGVAGLLATGYLIAAQWLIALLIILLGATVAVHLSSVRAPGLLFAGVLLGAAFTATLGVELFYVADFLQDTEWFRMNTVFKFYMQAWVLFGTGGAIALYALLGGGRWQRGLSWLGRVGRWAWLGALGVLLLAAGAFLIFGTPARLADAFPVRPPGPTLDGMAFMDGNQFSWGPITNTVTVNLTDDHAAYTWLLAHTHGWPVIATAPTAPDPNGEFVATYTGFPVVVGSLHQEEQRDPAQVAARRADMAELFRTADPARAVVLLRQYHVTYIYVGPYERALAADTPTGLAKFAALTGSALDLVYKNPGVTVYQVRNPAP